MIEMLSHLADGTCQSCGEPIGLTVGEWSPETWTHDSNGRPECPGAPVAVPDPATVVPVPVRP
jgi:hypothetical protein